MKGYVTPFGYMGWMKDRYYSFATEDEYREAYREAFLL